MFDFMEFSPSLLIALSGVPQGSVSGLLLSQTRTHRQSNGLFNKTEDRFLLSAGDINDFGPVREPG
jgi:hypothetical protein